jgi:hypothetical protein
MAIITPEELRSKLEKTYPVLCKDSRAEIDRKVKEVFPEANENPRKYLGNQG